MTEPIEKWKEEAREYIESIPDSMDDWNVCDIERAYIAGKMSQPVVELPAVRKTPNACLAVYISQVYASLKSSGINYRIKGE